MPKAYLEPYQTTLMEPVTKIINGFYLLRVFVRVSIMIIDGVLNTSLVAVLPLTSRNLSKEDLILKLQKLPRPSRSEINVYNTFILCNRHASAGQTSFSENINSKILKYLFIFHWEQTFLLHILVFYE